MKKETSLNKFSKSLVNSFGHTLFTLEATQAISNKASLGGGGSTEQLQTGRPAVQHDLTLSKSQDLSGPQSQL